eukprot:jgi/Tetstr1/439663/TSEL_028083.t2
MEALFEEGGALRFHPERAAVTAVAASAVWPPCLAAAGYARAVRGWQPDTAGQAFVPVQELRELDGARYSHVLFAGDRLVTLDASDDANVSVYETSGSTWQRKQTMPAGGRVESICAAGDFIAAGRADGKVRVWRLMPSEGEYKPLFSADLPVDTAPIRQLHLEEVAEGKEVLLVVYALGKASVGVWQLSTGKILHVWGSTGGSSDNSGGSAQSELSCVLSTLRGGVLGLVFWAPGAQADIHLMHILSGEGGRIPPDDRLQGGARPLAASFDGATLAVGFDNGALAVFGKKGWTRWHSGAVGCVQTIAAKEQVLSGAADGAVSLWNLDGLKLAEVRLAAAVTALSAGPLFAIAGAEHGDVQVIMLADGVDLELNKPACSGEEEPDTRQVAQYDPFFDSRWKHGGAASRASEATEEFGWFVPPEVLHTPDPEALAAMQQSKGKQGAAGETETAEADGAKADTAADPKADAKSNFDMGKALKGAEREAPEGGEGPKGGDGRGLNEPGVVRTGGKVMLESNTELVGRKCDNPSCLVRDGLGGAVFKRCSACRQRFYCSQHCQRTHWRDAHQKECKQLKEATSEES